MKRGSYVLKKVRSIPRLKVTHKTVRVKWNLFDW